MIILANQEIRNAAKQRGIRLWQVADALGITDATLSRKLRHELHDDERERVMGVIAQLASENARVS